MDEIIITTYREYEQRAKDFYAFCERETHLDLDNTLVVALSRKNPVGIVRLCLEHNVYVLRTMQIHPDFQRQKIGSAVLKRFDKLVQERNIPEIYCMPYAHLEKFYEQIEFKKIQTDTAPLFMQERLANSFLKNPNQPVILMMRSTSSGYHRLAK